MAKGGLLPIEIEYNMQRTLEDATKAMLEASPGLDIAFRDAVANSNPTNYLILREAARCLQTAEEKDVVHQKREMLVSASHLLGKLASPPDLSKVNVYLEAAGRSLKLYGKYWAMALGKDDELSDIE